MQVEQQRWTPAEKWKISQSNLTSPDTAQLVLVFGDTDYIDNGEAFSALKASYPNARFVGCSTAGNILGTESSDGGIVATAVFLEKSRIEIRTIAPEITADIASHVAATAKELLGDDLKHILILSDGLNFNGSEVARGVNVDERVPVTGGLAGDGGRFQKTLVIADGPAKPKQIVLVGFYGADLQVEYGCFAGWGEFGVNRRITQSTGNVVYQIDHQPALELYKSYLGDMADKLPASGLRFPLSIQNDDGTPLIRTLLSVDEHAQSLTFAGDVPEGSITLLMKGNADDLIEGAKVAAKQAYAAHTGTGLAVVISCVGRRMLMDQLTDGELEAVHEALGENVALTGFYSYGELAPYSRDFWQCQLHNQTMTLLALYEK